MSLSHINYPLTPVFDVLIDGKSLDMEIHTHLTSLTVDDHLHKVSMFAFDVEAADDAVEENAWIDYSGFEVGGKVEIKMGYGSKLASLFKGEITGLEPSFYCDRLPRLTVRGYDRGHRLQRGTRTRTFAQQKDSDIARQIATEAGLTAAVDDSQVTHEYVIQANLSDLEFLLARAEAINYEVVVEDQTLYFRKAASDQGSLVTLKMGDDVLEFHPRLTSAQQVSEVSVLGWSLKEKKNIQARATSLTEKVGGKNSGPSLSQSAFGDATRVITSQPVTTQAEADQMAQAALNRQALALIEGSGSCLGRADLKKGKMIEIKGTSERFDGQYYVTAVIHRFDQAS
ncbi:MAG TPA: contractile injection system protein, VgrG/Pvc8 family, partial [Blastocatellia bacterium]